ncbi:transporter [Starmerella bacillaris]|uniref:Protein YIP n=1 Tax=Starmerella bacillaris TaxID=1247836 RepID=A0AAV5RJU5_STABA|nr:transporter [Starmerella bacillaris]
MAYYANSQFNPAMGMASMGSMGSMQAQVDSAEEGVLSTGFLAAFGTSGYPDESSLLEELGVNFGHIAQKTKAVLLPISSGVGNEGLMNDSDLAGPVLFFLLFGIFLFLSRKSHFGYVYGFALVGTFLLYSILNLMADKHIDFMKTISVLGYSLLPLVLTALVGIGVNLNNLIGYLVGALAVLWCTFSASGIFIGYLQLSHVRVLVAYPLVLFYGVFTLLTLFQ